MVYRLTSFNFHLSSKLNLVSFQSTFAHLYLVRNKLSIESNIKVTFVNSILQNKIHSNLCLETLIQPCKLGINSRAREGCPLSRKNGKSKDNINKWKEPWPMNSTCSLLDSLKNSQVHDEELSKGNVTQHGFDF